MMNKEQLEGLCRTWIKQADDTLDKFREQLAENPAHALSWDISGAYRAVAERELARDALGIIEAQAEAGMDYPIWFKAFRSQYELSIVQRAAQVTSTSSNGFGNLMNDYRLAAEARFLQAFSERFR